MAIIQMEAGQFMVPVSELVPVFDSPVDRFLAGHLATSTAYGLRLQALYLRHAYKYDEGAGLSNARIEPALHQIYVAHRVVNKLRPRMILADEVGLGKTIEAGLILKELRARELIDRVLIVVPASLQFQWQHELSSKFNEQFEIIDGPATRFLGRGGANPWSKRDRIICSLNLAANPKHADNLTALDWDLVIFDEAHKVRRSGQRTTQAYSLADELKESTTGLLLLTATPMQLHPFELYSLIELVEPGLYQSFEDYDRRRAELRRLNDLMLLLLEWDTLADAERERRADSLTDTLASMVPGPDSGQRAVLTDQSGRQGLMERLIDEHPLTGVMARNRKAEVGGFTPREAVTLRVELTEPELELYDDVSEYLRHGYEVAQREKRFAVGFLMVLYQRMLTSSSAAVRESFKRRAAKLRGRLDVLQTERAPEAGRRAVDEMRDWEEATLSVDVIDQLAIDEAALEAEIAQLEALAERLGTIRDTKAAELIRGLRPILKGKPGEKVLIFTQYIETQRFLAAVLSANGYRCAVFNGSMRPEDKEAAVQAFREDVQILVSTEAGGEGRNFQFCHVLFNYDLPWNPMRVEQRIGRIDRIGQKQRVFIYNMVCADTVEERILEVLAERIGMFEESVGSLDPILGEIEKDIERIVLGQIGRYNEAFEELGVRIEQRVRRAREAEKIMADFILDRASFRRDEANSLLNRPPMATHSDLRRFMEDCLIFFGGRLDEHPDGGVVAALSPKLAARLRTRETTLRGVFDWKFALEKEELAFLAFGHELVDKTVALPLDDEASTGARRLGNRDDEASVEILYEIQAEGLARSGKVIRHLVGQNLSVASEILQSMPELGEDVGPMPVPDWARNAVAASTEVFEAEQGIELERIAEEHRRLQQQELDRANRIYSYRQVRLQRLIASETAWILETEASGTVRERRVLPARRGKVLKNQERLARLTAEYEHEQRLIEAKTPGVAARVLAVGLVVGQ